MFKINKSKVFLVMALLGLAILGSISASAQTSTSTAATSTLEATINQLMEQIKGLEAKIAELKSQVKAVAEELKIERTLRMGASGDDVKKLQEFLGQYPEFYPEGSITGYFGSLTHKAIKRLQSRHKLEEDGVLGARTICTLKAVFENEAGKSGHVPPGLLIAPGILKKIDCEIKPLAGQILPPGIISKISTSTPIVCYDNDDDEDENKKDDDDEDGDEDDDDEDEDDDKKFNKKKHKEKKLKRKCYFAPPTATSTPPIATSTDMTAPIISALTTTSTTATSTKIIWNTDELSDSKIWYGASAPISATGTPSISASALSLSHQFELINLTASSTYYYVVGSTDASANAATSSEQSFTTLP